jgi:uncharacterized protein YjbI with pentapeptide repeats
MARPGAKNLRDDERETIRRMFLAGVLVADIIRTTGRAETTIFRVVRDLDRKRPTSPPGRFARRNDKILALFEAGWSRAKICKRFNLRPSNLGVIIAQHPRIRERRADTRAALARLGFAPVGSLALMGTRNDGPWDPEHLEIVKAGAQATRDYRSKTIRPLTLAQANLRGVDLGSVCLEDATLRGADFSGANLSNATLLRANLTDACFRDCDLSKASFQGSNCKGANFSDAVLLGANFNFAILEHALLRGGSWDDADLARAQFGRTTIQSDLTSTRGLAKAHHYGRSSISHELLLRPTARGWPREFLRGCGLSDAEIDYAQSLATTPIEFYSCFISYSSKDDRFAVRLHDALQAKGIRCWLDKHEILPGDNLTKKIGEGIRLWDKVLLCCSRNSMTPSTGWWVTDEIERALQKERQLQKERNAETLAVIPLNLDGFLFDPACTHEHAPTLTKRHAAKFVGWDTDEKVFDEQLARVVKALRADALARPKPPPSKL